jgi:hypothetical protein
MEYLVAFIAEYLYAGIVVAAALYLLIVHRSRWKELLLAALFIGALSLALSLIAHRLIIDPRPFAAAGTRPLIPSSVDNGFPSDHTLLLAAVAAVLLTVNPRAGLLALFGALIVGIARVYVGVHHLHRGQHYHRGPGLRHIPGDRSGMAPPPGQEIPRIGGAERDVPREPLLDSALCAAL